MFAISIWPSQPRALSAALAAVVSTLAVGQSCARASDGPAQTNHSAFLAFAQRELDSARQQRNASPTNTEFVLQFARATFDRAEFATNDTERAELAVQGIAACRQVLRRASNSAPAHYYLGLNLGQLARTRLLGALPLVDEMEVEFLKATQLDARFNYAGPHRTLGLLYLNAPVIGSVGSRSKARKHLNRAVELAPEFPENRLNLAEALLHWRDRREAREQVRLLELSIPAARTNLAGEAWAASWADWEKRLAEAKQAANNN